MSVLDPDEGQPLRVPPDLPFTAPVRRRPSTRVNTPARIREARRIVGRIFDVPEHADRVLDDVVESRLRAIPPRG